MQYIHYFQRIGQARKSSKQRHANFLRSMAGATYRHELGQSQVEESLPLTLRPTVLVPVVKPSAHTERHTDKYNLRDLMLTDLLDHAITRYKREHCHKLPKTIFLSHTNIYLLMLQDIFAMYRNDCGEFKLLADDSLDSNTIICSEFCS